MIKFPSFFSIILLILLVGYGCSNEPKMIEVKDGDHIVLLGNNLGSRMMNFGHFETEMYLRYPTQNVLIRNMCDPGDTPGFRPRSARNSPWAFPGAETFQTELANDSRSIGHFPAPDEWLHNLEADIIIAFFGYNESFEGEEGLANYKAELQAFIAHTLAQNYNGATPPQLVLVSPIAFQDLSDTYDLPNGTEINANLKAYTAAMKEIASQSNIPFIDAFNTSYMWFKESQLTTDGSQLNDEGYQRFASMLASKLSGESSPNDTNRDLVLKTVLDKNWFWHNDYKIPNGVHAYGRRYDPFGPANYPYEIEKIRQMTSVRDTAIWMATAGQEKDIKVSDQNTRELPEVETNYNPDSRKHGQLEYLYGQDALDKLQVPQGYKIELFASEKEFPELANPSQLTFDNQGRLWVSTMPSYPHYRPGDKRPDDKIIILEDTDKDGKADKLINFATGLHVPVGFEIAPEGVYISQGTNLKLYTDTDGDDQADKVEIIMSGFDDHDTHHVISAFCADPSGAIYMGEGVFLHTNVETSYGPVRGTNGGFYRYQPQLRKLERTAQLSIPNPWGIAFDIYGQNFFLDTSGPAMRWMMPGTIKSVYGKANPKPFDLIQDEHKVRPTSGLEFVSSRHFPDEVQGDLLLGNAIGFLGIKQHSITDDGTGFKTAHRQDLLTSDDGNFRPVDMEFAPDGSLYVVDWHNILIGHMQHNARDPLRDHVHGRIYRITYPSRPLLTPPDIDGASIDVLLDNLKLQEARARYRTRRELRGRSAQEVTDKLKTWVSNLDASDPNYERYKLEALWVSWGMDEVDQALLRDLLNAKDFHVRTAAVRVLRYTGHQVQDQAELLSSAVADPDGRVQLEAMVASSWLDEDQAAPILASIDKEKLDEWSLPVYEGIEAHLSGKAIKKEVEIKAPTNLNSEALKQFELGRAIYEREGYCGTCHQPDGKGLTASGFPPLAGSEWVLGDTQRLIKIALKGVYGPMTVMGKDYPGQVPMTGFEKMLNDEELAAVLTYVRNAFGNEAEPVTKIEVFDTRYASQSKEGFYTSDELLKMHPFAK